ncbi:imm11 family protein [Paraburkholderia jirisanensis]
MTIDFFEIGLDYDDLTRWYLGQPATSVGKVLPGTFRNCMPWSGLDPLSVEILQAGTPATFNHSGHSVYIVTKEIVKELQSTLGPDLLQGIPISVISHPGNYAVLNVLDSVDCVDEENSEFSRWTAEDGRPEQIGGYRMSLLRIDPERARGHDLFRVKGWEIALICSKKIKQCLEKAGVTGIRFKPVVHRE